MRFEDSKSQIFHSLGKQSPEEEAILNIMRKTISSTKLASTDAVVSDFSPAFKRHLRHFQELDPLHVDLLAKKTKKANTQRKP